MCGEIKIIMGNIDCRNDFQCYKKGMENFNKIKCDFLSTICEAITKDAIFCKYSVPFGYGYFCICPLLKYLIEECKNDDDIRGDIE